MKKTACVVVPSHECHDYFDGDCDFKVDNQYNGCCIYRTNGVWCGNPKAWPENIKEEVEDR